MEITASTQNDITVLALQGRLDGLASPQLEQRLEALVAAGTRKVVLDCSALNYVSSAGLRVFLGGAKKLKSAGGRAAFAAAQALAKEKGWVCNWRLVETRGVAHEAAFMFAAREAGDAIFGK